MINNGWQLAPWADVLYACDYAWWEKYQGVPEFAGLKLAADSTASRRPWGVRHIELNRSDDRLGLIQRGRVGWGGNGGFHCLNLAVQTLPAKIILVGYDMSLRNGLHWHGAHQGLNTPTALNVERWRRVTDAAAEPIRAMGIRVVNCSAASALRNYEKMPLEEAMEC